LADPNTRQGKRTPVTLKIKFKSETLEQFIERYAVDVSQGGIFIRTKEPLAVGTQMKFEFQLRDASPLISGEGTVVWTRENDPSRPAIAPGMGVRFDRLNEGSQQVLERILAEKAKQAPQRGGNESVTKPPMFTDTPTKVVPMSAVDALGAAPEPTPLPKPTPFQSDADEFDENAFQEATKVRSLDELAAASAGIDSKADETATDAMPPDELAARRQPRAETPLAEPPAPDSDSPETPEPDSVPGLPPAPEQGRTGRLLDTSPSPRTESPTSPPTTKPGVEPAKPAAARVELADKVAIPRAIPHDQGSGRVAARRPSIAPTVIVILLLVAGALAGVWWFVIRPGLTEEAPATTPVVKQGGSGGALAHGGAGSAAVATQPNIGSGSASEMRAGSAVASGSAQGSSSGASTPAATVETVIMSTAAKATVEIEGTDGRGPAPFTAKLEKDKPYKARISAPGFVAREVDVKGGQDKITVKLDAKPRTISVTSDPPGALVLVEGAPTGKLTPADVEVSPAQAAKPKLRVTLRKAGFRSADLSLDASAWTEDDARVSAKADAKLVVMTPVVVQRPNGGGGTGSSSAGASAGSGETPGNGGGETKPPDNGTKPPDPPKPPDESKPPAGGGEPEPDWSKPK
jgi:uncharacterized protein (TIGR02266 family)